MQLSQRPNWLPVELTHFMSVYVMQMCSLESGVSLMVLLSLFLSLARNVWELESVGPARLKSIGNRNYTTGQRLIGNCTHNCKYRETTNLVLKTFQNRNHFSLPIFLSLLLFPFILSPFFLCFLLSLFLTVFVFISIYFSLLLFFVSFFVSSFPSLSKSFTLSIFVS